MANQDRICYVVGAMSLSLSLRPSPAPGDYVIAADRGYDSLMAYGVTPDLVVGDFDSLGYTPQHPNVTQLPAEKDDTDMVFALRRGLELGYRRFVLLGGLGGRLEHTLGNLQLLDWLSTQGAVGFLAGEKTVVTALRDSSLAFPPTMSGYLSVLCKEFVNGRISAFIASFLLFAWKPSQASMIVVISATSCVVVASSTFPAASCVL